MERGILNTRRSKLEIMLKVLKVIGEGVNKPTRIMYAANISWNPTQKILSRLIEQGLITNVMNTSGRKSKQRYVITPKGISILDYFDNVNKILPIELVEI